MGPQTRSGRGLILAMAAWMLPAIAGAASGALSAETFPSADDHFEPLLADPTELGYGGRYILQVGGDRFGEVMIGDYVGLLRRDFGSWGAQWNLGGGAHARFNLTTEQNSMQVVDFTAASPFDVYWGEGHTVRTGLWHTSSHLGDDYIRLNRATVRKRSMDYVKTLYSYVPGERYRFYAGGSFAVNTINIAGAGSLQCGAEFMGPYYGDHRAQTFLAQDLQAWERIGWNPSYTVRAGVRLADKKRIAAARVFVEYFSGRQLYLQFFELHESRWSFGLNFEIGNPARR